MSDQFSRSSGGLHCRAFFQRLHKHKRPRNVAFRLLNELHLNAIALRLENNNSFARRDLNSNYVIINLMGVDLRLFWMTDSIFQSFRGVLEGFGCFWWQRDVVVTVSVLRNFPAFNRREVTFIPVQ